MGSPVISCPFVQSLLLWNRYHTRIIKLRVGIHFIVLVNQRFRCTIFEFMWFQFDLFSSIFKHIPWLAMLDIHLFDRLKSNLPKFTYFGIFWFFNVWSCLALIWCHLLWGLSLILFNVLQDVIFLYFRQIITAWIRIVHREVFIWKVLCYFLEFVA